MWRNLWNHVPKVLMMGHSVSCIILCFLYGMTRNIALQLRKGSNSIIVPITWNPKYLKSKIIKILTKRKIKQSNEEHNGSPASIMSGESERAACWVRERSVLKWGWGVFWRVRNALKQEWSVPAGVWYETRVRLACLWVLYKAVNDMVNSPPIKVSGHGEGLPTETHQASPPYKKTLHHLLFCTWQDLKHWASVTDYELNILMYYREIYRNPVTRTLAPQFKITDIMRTTFFYGWWHGTGEKRPKTWPSRMK